MLARRVFPRGSSTPPPPLPSRDRPSAIDHFRIRIEVGRKVAHRLNELLIKLRAVDVQTPSRSTERWFCGSMPVVPVHHVTTPLPSGVAIPAGVSPCSGLFRSILNMSSRSAWACPCTRCSTSAYRGFTGLRKRRTYPKASLTSVLPSLPA